MTVDPGNACWAGVAWPGEDLAAAHGSAPANERGWASGDPATASRATHSAPRRPHRTGWTRRRLDSWLVQDHRSARGSVCGSPRGGHAEKDPAHSAIGTIGGSATPVRRRSCAPACGDSCQSSDGSGATPRAWRGRVGHRRKPPACGGLYYSSAMHLPADGPRANGAEPRPWTPPRLEQLNAASAAAGGGGYTSYREGNFVYSDGSNNVYSLKTPGGAFCGNWQKCVWSAYARLSG